MLAVVYLRVSTDQQADKGLSIPAQEKDCRRKAQELGYDRIEVFADEGESARSDDRPGLQSALERCKKGDVKAFIVHKLDRLARNTYDHALIKVHLKKYGVRLLSVTENIDDSPEGEVLEGMMAVLAQYYSKNLAREVLKGMNERAEMGYWNSKAPLGYKNVSELVNGKKVDKRVEVDDAVAPLIREAFQLYASGRYSTIELAEHLWNRGLRTVYGKRVFPSVLARLLKKRFYVGIQKWNGIESEGKHKPIVDLTLFNTVQKMFEIRLGSRDMKRKHVFVLRGPTLCAECGSHITGERHSTSAGKDIWYYRCSKRQKTKSVTCGQSYVPVDELEQAVRRVVLDIKFREAAVERLRAKLKRISQRENGQLEATVARLRNQISDIDRRERVLLEKLLDKKIDDELYGEMKNELGDKKLELKASLQRNETQMEAAVRILERALTFAVDTGKAYDEATPDLRQAYVRQIFSRLEVKDGKLQKVVLNEPVDFLCRELKTNKKNAILFDSVFLGDPTGDRTPISRMRT